MGVSGCERGDLPHARGPGRQAWKAGADRGRPAEGALLVSPRGPSAPRPATSGAWGSDVAAAGGGTAQLGN
eukprot:14157564-Alexandrium_andersonii.AAC.1